MITVCLSDPQPIVQEGFKSVLEACEDFEFLSAVASLEEASLEIERHRPTIVVVDRGFGMHKLIEWVEQVPRNSPQTEVVVWAAAISDVECFRALRAGARGIVKKTSSTSALLECLREVSRKQLWTENLFLNKDSPLGRPRNRPLTPREQEVAALVVKGLKNREIGEALNIFLQPFGLFVDTLIPGFVDGNRGVIGGNRRPDQVVQRLPDALRFLNNFHNLQFQLQRF